MNIIWWTMKVAYSVGVAILLTEGMASVYDKYTAKKRAKKHMVDPDDGVTANECFVPMAEGKYKPNTLGCSFPQCYRPCEYCDRHSIRFSVEEQLEMAIDRREILEAIGADHD